MPCEVIGRRLTEILPEAESEWIDMCGRIAYGGDKVKFKSHFKTLGKDLEILAYSPQPGQLATLISDITSRVDMLTALRQSEESFRAIADNASDGIFVACGFDGPYLFANRRASEISGYSTSELLTMGPVRLVPGEQRFRIKHRIERRLKGKAVLETYQTGLLRRDGRILPVEVSGSRILWQGLPAVLIEVRDISIFKRLEGEWHNVNQELERRVQERTRKLMDVARQLAHREEELSKQQTSLERVNKELVETNNALSVLARNIDRKCDELEQKIARLVGSRILPIIDELRADRLPEKSLVKLDELRAHLEDLTGGAAKGKLVIVSLSSMELRVALMIKKDSVRMKSPDCFIFPRIP
jgi:PAS domain S-box-containing protein